MALGDVWFVRLQQQLLGQVVLNTFHFQSKGSSDVTSTPVFIAQMVLDYYAVQFVDVQSEQLQYVNSYARHLAGDEEEATYPTAIYGGTQSGDCLPPHDAWAFRFNRSSTATRHGQKRLAGIPETLQHQGVVIDTTTIGLLDDCANAMEHIFTAADGLNSGAELHPVIYSTILNGELRGSVVDGVFVPAPIVNVVSSVEYVRISTQNTRKLYR
jgi:hypothetical protein